MVGTAVITLPNGIWREGTRVAAAAIRPLTGEDEEFLLYEGTDLSPAARSTALLARCTKRLGNESPVPLEVVRALPAGDREAILLSIRRLSFGDRIESTLSCPHCGQMLDLDLHTGDLLLSPYADALETHEGFFAESPERYAIRFRLPTGADLEAAVVAAQENADSGVRTLLDRCVLEASRLPEGSSNERPPTPIPVNVSSLPQEVVDQLSQRMSELDPQAEIDLAMECPACKRRFQSLLDAGAFLFAEVEQRARRLYQEVHTLAFHYHWSEQDILRMTSRKRQRYLELLRSELGGDE